MELAAEGEDAAALQSGRAWVAFTAVMSADGGVSAVSFDWTARRLSAFLAFGRLGRL